MEARHHLSIAKEWDLVAFVVGEMNVDLREHRHSHGNIIRWVETQVLLLAVNALNW